LRMPSSLWGTTEATETLEPALAIGMRRGSGCSQTLTTASPSPPSARSSISMSRQSGKGSGITLRQAVFPRPPCLAASGNLSCVMSGQDPPFPAVLASLPSGSAAQGAEAAGGEADTGRTFVVTAPSPSPDLRLERRNGWSARKFW
jgi:hypothetical protein